MSFAFKPDTRALDFSLFVAANHTQAYISVAKVVSETFPISSPSLVGAVSVPSFVWSFICFLVPAPLVWRVHG